MSLLHGFDGITLLGENFYNRFVLTIEQRFAEAIGQAEDADRPSDAGDTEFELTAIRDGVEELLVETLANLILTIPRVMYATRNTDYGSNFTVDHGNPAVPDTEKLVDRLHEFERVGTVVHIERPVYRDVNIDGPLLFGGQPNRLTLLRPDFFDLDHPPTITFHDGTPGSIQVRVEGRVYLGRRFNRWSAERSTDTYSLDLRFEPAYVDTGDEGLGVPTFIVDTLTCPRAGNYPTLPPIGQPVYAQRSENVRRRFVLPPADATAEDLRGKVFRGHIGTQIFDTEADVLADNPHYEVRRIEEGSCLGRTVLVDLDSDLPVARTRSGRVMMRFIGVTDLILHIAGETFTGAQQSAVEESLIPIPPMSRSLFSDSGDPTRRLCNRMELKGDRGFDFAIYPGLSYASFDPRIEDVVIPDCPSGFHVVSEVSEIVYSETAVIKEAGHPGVIVLAGEVSTTATSPCITPSSLPGRIERVHDFSNGADLTTATSQEFLDSVLLVPLNEAVENALLDEPEIDHVTLCSRIRDGQIVISGSGDGELEDAILWSIDVPFDFSVSIPLRLRLQNSVLRDGEKVPIDAYGCQIPAVYWDPEADNPLGIIRPQQRGEPDVPAVEVYTIPEGGPVERNPLCFLGFCDPGPDQLFCEPPLAIAPPVLDANGDEVLSPPCCADETEDCPDPQARRQMDFPSGGGFPRLTHALEPYFVAPTKDEIDFDYDIPWWAYLLITIFSVFGTVILALIVLISIIASLLSKFSVGGGSIGEKANSSSASQQSPSNLSLDPHISLKSYPHHSEDSPAIELIQDRDDPAYPDEPAEAQQSVMVNRHRVIIEVQDADSGLEGMLDDAGDDGDD